MAPSAAPPPPALPPSVNPQHWSKEDQGVPIITPTSQRRPSGTKSSPDRPQTRTQRAPSGYQTGTNRARITRRGEWAASPVSPVSPFIYI